MQPDTRETEIPNASLLPQPTGKTDDLTKLMINEQQISKEERIIKHIVNHSSTQFQEPASSRPQN